MLFKESECIKDLPALQITPTSSPWLQLLEYHPLLLHCTILVSEPRHCTSSNKIGPVPFPKWLPDTDRLFALLLKIHVYKKWKYPKKPTKIIVLCQTFMILHFPMRYQHIISTAIIHSVLKSWSDLSLSDWSVTHWYTNFTYSGFFNNTHYSTTFFIPMKVVYRIFHWDNWQLFQALPLIFFYFIKVSFVLIYKFYPSLCQNQPFLYYINKKQKTQQCDENRFSKLNVSMRSIMSSSNPCIL